MNDKALVLEAMQRGGSISAIWIRLKREGHQIAWKVVRRLVREIEQDNKEDVNSTWKSN